jgi:hypothetical protein
MKKTRRVTFRYGEVDYENYLVWIAASHNQPIYWLRERLQSDGAFHSVVGQNERVNFAFPGLLLRLADIMDFDSSRTPPILYRHLGLDDELGIDLSASRKEWNKHLAITGIEYKQIDRQPTIVYSAINCPHPVVEKTIRTFVGWIGKELRGVRDELAWQQRDPDLDSRRFELALPEVKAEITARKKGERPVYIFEDIQFRLDQNEILRLLTGERLYGDSTLCIRELLQNALDACELRDLRLRMKAKGKRLVEPVDGTPSRDSPGYFLDDAGQKRRLEVRLTWGHDETLDQYWLQVEDNGTGMTEHVIKQYFIQIGKSYYSSLDFREEQADLRSIGLLATPVSQFGIGILSCFMLADRIEVRTCPGGHSPNRPARDIIISGPDKLFWLRDGTRTTQGTEVKLWLKHKINKAPLKLEHDPNRWLSQLRLHFGYVLSHKDFDQISEIVQPNSLYATIIYPPYPIVEGTFDPAYAAGQWVVWPKYPIVLEGLSRSAFELNDRFHMDHLTPIDRLELLQIAEEWGVPPERLGDARWGIWDWDDAITGSRIRLSFPCWDQVWAQTVLLPIDPPASSLLCRQRELAAFVESQLAYNVDNGRASRQRMLLNGIFVPNNPVLENASKVWAQAGANVWVNLVGEAALPLTADRKTVIPADMDTWYQCVDGVFERFMTCLSERVRQTPASLTSILASWSGLITADHEDFWLVAARYQDTHDWWKAIEPPYPISPAFLNRVFLQSISFGRDLNLYSEMHSGLFLVQSLSRKESDHANYRALAGYLANLTAESLKLELMPLAQLSGNRLNPGAPGRDTKAYNQSSTLLAGLEANVLQEAFFPDVRRSWPWLGLYHLSGMVGNATLVGPTLLHFEFEADGCTLHAVDSQRRESEAVVLREYDLVFPTTVVPLGQLRQRCAAWRKYREPRRLGVLPFVVPSVKFTQKDLEKLRAYFCVDRIYALLPSRNLWSVRFADWQSADWNHSENVSALWNLKSGGVLWARGTGDLSWISQEGRPPDTFFGWGSDD